MPLRTYPGRLLALSAASSALALGVSGTVAAVLYAEQSRTAEVLSEDIGSRGAAMNLDATLDTLVARHSRGAGEVGPLHEQGRRGAGGGGAVREQGVGAGVGPAGAGQPGHLPRPVGGGGEADRLGRLPAG